MAIYSWLSIAILTFFGYLQLTVNSHFNVFLANDSQCRYLFGIQGGLFVKSFIYLSLYLAEILFCLLLKHFFMMVRLRINDFPLR